MKKVAIMYGGPGKEHEVSVNSARNILENIDRSDFEVIEIFVDKALAFFVKEEEATVFDFNNKYSELEIFNFIKENKIEKIFPVFHGIYGEGGDLQKKLEDNNIDFVGSGSVTSYNAINKILANKIFTENSILIPKTEIINSKNLLEIENILKKFHIPSYNKANR